MEKLKRLLPTLALIVLAAASGIVLQQLEDSPLKVDADTNETPDFFMENFTSVVMDLDGKPLRELQAKRMDHYPDTKTRHLTSPYLILNYPDRPSWHVRSERGWIYESGLVVLLGPVHAWRNTITGERAIDIHTRDMRILPDKEFGETDEHVTITTQSQQSTGMGMRAYLAEDRLELMARVATEVTGHITK